MSTSGNVGGSSNPVYVNIDGQNVALNPNGPNAVTVNGKLYMIDNISISQSQTQPGDNVISFSYTTPPSTEPRTLSLTYPPGAGDPNIFAPDPTTKNSTMSSNPWFTVNFLAVFIAIMNQVSALQRENQYLDMQLQIKGRLLSVDIAKDLGELAEQEKNAEAAQQITTAVSEAVQAGVGILQLKANVDNAAKAQREVTDLETESKATEDLGYDKLAMRDPNVQNNLKRMLGVGAPETQQDPIEGESALFDENGNMKDADVEAIFGSPCDKQKAMLKNMRSKLADDPDKPLNTRNLKPEEVKALKTMLTGEPPNGDPPKYVPIAGVSKSFTGAREKVVDDPDNIEAKGIHEEYERATSPSQKRRLMSEKFTEYNATTQATFQTLSHMINSGTAATQSYFLKLEGAIQKLQQVFQGYKTAMDSLNQSSQQQESQDQQILDGVLQDMNQVVQANNVFVQHGV